MLSSKSETNISKYHIGYGMRGWYRDQYRHSLAARGISSRKTLFSSHRLAFFPGDTPDKIESRKRLLNNINRLKEHTDNAVGEDASGFSLALSYAKDAVENNDMNKLNNILELAKTNPAYGKFEGILRIIDDSRSNVNTEKMFQNLVDSAIKRDPDVSVMDLTSGISVSEEISPKAGRKIIGKVEIIQEPEVNLKRLDTLDNIQFKIMKGVGIEKEMTPGGRIPSDKQKAKEEKMAVTKDEIEKLVAELKRLDTRGYEGFNVERARIELSPESLNRFRGTQPEPKEPQIFKWDKPFEPYTGLPALGEAITGVTSKKLEIPRAKVLEGFLPGIPEESLSLMQQKLTPRSFEVLRTKFTGAEGKTPLTEQLELARYKLEDARELERARRVDKALKDIKMLKPEEGYYNIEQLRELTTKKEKPWAEIPKFKEDKFTVEKPLYANYTKAQLEKATASKPFGGPVLVEVKGRQVPLEKLPSRRIQKFVSELPSMKEKIISGFSSEEPFEFT
jgi:hypothetical protein